MRSKWVRGDGQRTAITPLAAVLTGILCGVNGLAIAQTPAAPEQAGAGLQEVVVTAQRREQNLQETPIAVSAFNADSLAALGATDFTAISGYVPNLNLMPEPGQNGTIANIRGIGSSDPALTVDAKVGLYIDGVYVGRNTGTVFELDIDRIEVMRGPQGTLWGKNTTGGSINIVTARPQGELGLMQDFGVGEYGHLRARTVLDLPALDLGTVGTLSTRLTYLKTMSDGWATRSNSIAYGSAELGQLDSDSYRFAADWNPINDLSIQYAYDRVQRGGTARQDQLIGGASSLGIASYASRRHRIEKFELNYGGNINLDLKSHILNMKLQRSGVTLKSISGYREVSQYDVADLDGTPVTFSSILLQSGRPYTGGLYDFSSYKDQKQFSQELQVIGDFANGRANYTMGAYYSDENGMEDSAAALYIGAYGAFTDTARAFTYETESKAIYGQVTWTPSIIDGRLHFTVGGRYTEDNKKVHKTIHVGLPADLRGKKSWSNFSPAGTIEYAANDDVNLYLRVAKGYNAGIFSIRSTSSFNNPANEETVLSYELGMKSEWLDRRLRLNLATFLSDYSDLQQFPYIAGESTAINVGKTNLWGLEVEASAKPTEAVTVGLSYGYLDYKIKDFVINGVDRSNTAVVAFAPANVLSTYLEYALPTIPIGKPILRLDGVYKDRVNFDTLSYMRSWAEPYALLNARVTLEKIPFDNADISLSLWGRNLTNESNQVMGIDFGEFQTGTFGDPRAYGIDLRMKF